MKRDSRASKISNIVNSTLFNPIEVGIELTTDHRYLQNEEFKTFLHFAGQLARNYEKGLYDDRNEFACKSALAMIEGLKRLVCMTESIGTQGTMKCLPNLTNKTGVY